jgi:hypothetical protein
LPEGLPDACEVLDDLTLDPPSCRLTVGTWVLPPDLAASLNLFLARAELYPGLAKKVLDENDRIWRVVVKGLVKVHHARTVVAAVTAQAESSGDWRAWEVVLLSIGVGVACLLAGTGLGALALVFG